MKVISGRRDDESSRSLRYPHIDTSAVVVRFYRFLGPYRARHDDPRRRASNETSTRVLAERARSRTGNPRVVVSSVGRAESGTMCHIGAGKARLTSSALEARSPRKRAQSARGNYRSARIRKRLAAGVRPCRSVGDESAHGIPSSLNLIGENRRSDGKWSETRMDSLETTILPGNRAKPKILAKK